MIGVRWVGYPTGRRRHAVLAGDDVPVCGGRWSVRPRGWSTVRERHARYSEPCYLCEWRLEEIKQSEADLDERLIEIVALRQAIAETIVEDLLAVRSMDELDEPWWEQQHTRLRAWQRLSRQASAMRGEP